MDGVGGEAEHVAVVSSREDEATHEGFVLERVEFGQAGAAGGGVDVSAEGLSVEEAVFDELSEGASDLADELRDVGVGTGGVLEFPEVDDAGGVSGEFPEDACGGGGDLDVSSSAGDGASVTVALEGEEGSGALGGSGDERCAEGFLNGSGGGGPSELEEDPADLEVDGAVLGVVHGVAVRVECGLQEVQSVVGDACDAGGPGCESLSVEEGAVGLGEGLEGDRGFLDGQARVASGDGEVIEAQVGVGSASDEGLVLDESEGAAKGNGGAFGDADDDGGEFGEQVWPCGRGARR